MSEGQIERMMEKLESIREIVSRIEGTVGSHEREIERHAAAVEQHDAVLFKNNGGQRSVMGRLEEQAQSIRAIQGTLRWGLGILTAVLVTLAAAGILRLVQIDREVGVLIRELSR